MELADVSFGKRLPRQMVFPLKFECSKKRLNWNVFRCGKSTV